MHVNSVLLSKSNSFIWTSCDCTCSQWDEQEEAVIKVHHTFVLCIFPSVSLLRFYFFLVFLKQLTEPMASETCKLWSVRSIIILWPWFRLETMDLWSWKPISTEFSPSLAVPAGLYNRRSGDSVDRWLWGLWTGLHRVITLGDSSRQQLKAPGKALRLPRAFRHH